jgi:hypothetical protein
LLFLSLQGAEQNGQALSALMKKEFFLDLLECVGKRDTDTFRVILKKPVKKTVVAENDITTFENYMNNFIETDRFQLEMYNVRHRRIDQPARYAFAFGLAFVGAAKLLQLARQDEKDECDCCGYAVTSEREALFTAGFSLAGIVTVLGYPSFRQWELQNHLQSSLEIKKLWEMFKEQRLKRREE